VDTIKSFHNQMLPAPREPLSLVYRLAFLKLLKTESIIYTTVSQRLFTATGTFQSPPPRLGNKGMVLSLFCCIVSHPLNR
jgi:hypothetical protein